MLNLINILNIKKQISKTITQKEIVKHKLLKIDYIYLVGKIITDILDKRLKLDIRLVKDVRDNVEIMGSYLNKELMKNPRGIKGLMKKIMNPIIRRRRGKLKRLKLKELNNFRRKEQKYTPTWLNRSYVKHIK